VQIRKLFASRLLIKYRILDVRFTISFNHTFIILFFSLFIFIFSFLLPAFVFHSIIVPPAGGLLYYRNFIQLCITTGKFLFLVQHQRRVFAPLREISLREKIKHHILKPVSAIFRFLQPAYFFFWHNLQPGLFQFYQRQNIYFPDVQNTIRKQMMPDTSPAILSK
jgi:hypothetical protein